MKKILSVTASVVLSVNAFTLNIIPGWQLKGTNEDINVSVFNKTGIVSVWTYDAINKKWKVYLPNKSIDLNRFGIEKLDKINKYEGFWINSLSQMTINTQLQNNENNSTENEINNTSASSTSKTFDNNITTVAKALEYLNYLRGEAGMVPLHINESLNEAALNHSIYMKVNNYFSHYESEGKPHFTGVRPADRAIYAGYLSKVVLENISYGNKDYKDSIDSLMSAIYHRLGFLDISKDEIGIGNDGEFYTYDLGNSNLNTLCGEDSFEGSGAYYTNVCSDENKKIKADDFNNGIFEIEQANTQIIMWPPRNSSDIPPAFFEECPDPLPDYGVSGYPISVTFNKYYFKNAPQVISFRLFNSDGSEITNTRLLDKDTDPNKRLDEYSYALFPLNRLDWNAKYKAEVVYKDDNNVTKTIDWDFTTRKLPYPYYKIDDTKANLKVVSGKTYVIYFVPQNGNDKLGGIRCGYPSDVKINDGYIDQNTIYISLTGNKGEYANCTFGNGDELNLTIADSDNAN